MKTKNLVLTALLLIVAGGFSACKDEPKETVGNVENPLTDLPWLKAKTEEIDLIIQSGTPLSVSIYQCMYVDEKTGFLEDRGDVAFFYSCDGEVLCMMDRNTGKTCSGLQIVCEKLIWRSTKETVCNVENPLTDLPWLKEYCEHLNEAQDFSSVCIFLYKTIDTDEHLFRINVSHSELDDSPIAYSEDWKNCTGNLVFGINSGVPPMPELVENFMKDKEFVAELFRLVKQ